MDEGATFAVDACGFAFDCYDLCDDRVDCEAAVAG